ncbi:MAG: homocitrate synthase [Deltaproteobacteria bacterium]|nr:homocitrate synthase [Deltaproteobacteria bacterium]
MTGSVQLVDTTLRDGEQAPGLAFSLQTRLTLAAALDQAGVAQLEIGCPAMGPQEVAGLKAIRKVCSRALVSTWNRIRATDVTASLETGAEVIHLCLPVTAAHLERKLKKTWAELAGDLTECLNLIQAQGARVSVGLEDVSRATPLELARAADLLQELAISWVRLSDTVGILTPGRVRSLVGFFVGRGFSVEFHGHNDLGLAAANTLTAALAGAARLDTTLGGVGERAGNCGLRRLVALAGAELELGVSLAQATELEELARPYYQARSAYVRGLLAAKAAGVESFFKIASIDSENKI